MRKRLAGGFMISLASLVTALAIFCTGVRVYEVWQNEFEAIGITAAGLILTEGEAAAQGLQKNESEQTNVYKPVETINNTDNTSEVQSQESHEGERTFPVVESKYTASGTGYDNFYVKNTTGAVINIGKLLKANLGFEVKNTTEPQVLIVHTHSCESYMDTDAGYYYESYYPRSTDDSRNVIRVGEALVEKLNSAGINAINDATHHDDPCYNGSYDRSYETIQNYLKKYPSISVVIDLHRDALQSEDQTKIKPTFVVNGKKAAQIMIMSGYDADGSYGFPDWEYNLRFALKLQQKAETLYPGMTRPLYFGDFVYNMNVNTGSLLIEVGTDANTLDEAVYSGELLGNVIAQVLNENMK